MRYFQTQVLLLFILIFSLTASAQKVKHSSTFKKHIKYAEEYMDFEEYHNAVELLLKVEEEGEIDQEWNYLVGISYLFSSNLNKSKALKYLQKVVDKEEYPDIQYYLAKALQYNHKFSEAKEIYGSFLTYNQYLDDDEIEDITFLKSQCETSIELMNDSLEMLIINLGPNINTEYPEIAPVLSADERTLVFTSRRSDSHGGEIDPVSGMYYEDIYISRRDDSGNWDKAEPIGKTINTSGHDAAVGLSPSGNTLFLYKSDNKASGKLLAGNIYMSEWNGANWSTPSALPKGINSDNWETHATLTADGKSLYFTSNRSGKDAFGETDIYVAHKDEYGAWGEPTNLGENINTKFPEESPFVHPNGKVLYFSSKGHKGMGGYDIFYSEWDDNKQEWSRAKNIGYPINTADDDIFYSISADGERGFFSSIRDDSEGGQDIYMAIIPSQTINVIALNGEVRDDESGNLIEATVEVINNETGEVVHQEIAKGGKYLMYLEPNNDYGFRVSHNGYLFHSKNINIKDQTDYIELVENIKLQKTADQKREELKNIFFSSYSDLENKSSYELKALASYVNQLDEFVIDISVHSARGMEKDSIVNLNVTQARAEAIVKSLTQLGISIDKIAAKGYGWQHPVASNDIKTGRMKNERIEYVVRTPEELVVFEEVVEEVPLPVIIPELGEVMDIKGIIMFAVSSNSITPESFYVIDQVVNVMDKYPNLVIEVGGHTDNTGTSSFNYILGEKRARIIVQQLVILGIEKNRLKYKSYGFDSPVADNNTEEGRMKNRRISFTPLEFLNEQ
ncbi:hypothetical protein EI427_20245 [Flammeovirga pectinis]|uniref:OmpA-like domain-containing protein n=1 Tax=Flammeovirga pectinis TaxID=2494373 RepID=A0A3Q9FRL8_9BACT|nr:OmpA family protein [Flammeovirga pectinis]AZQ64455.1 hypothetical protein EI427_20245 [Flammeovirga pectinis]